MREELKGPKVEDVQVAVVQEEGELGAPIYNVYLLNLKNVALEGVLVSSRGYATSQETQQKIETSMLRHYLETVAPKSYKKIEPIMEDVFGLNNEYWVSFWIDRKMYDKKFIFLSETITDKNLTKVPLLDKPGVVIA